MKELKDKIELTLLPCDFEQRDGEKPTTVAFRRITGYQDALMDSQMYINVYRLKITYKYSEIYYSTDWGADFKRARASNFRGKEPIRTIVLNRVK